MSARTATFGLSMALLGAAAAQGCGGDDGLTAPGPAVREAAVTVQWRLVGEGGEETTCGAEDIASTYVAVGGEPIVVACGDGMAARFEELTPGRFPVVVRLLSPNDRVVDEHVGNLVLAEGEDRTYDVEFSFDDSGQNTGVLAVRWTVQGGDPATQCGRLDGDTVEVSTQAGSIGEFEASAPCEDGSLVVRDLRPGSYVVRYILRDSAGGIIAVRQYEDEVDRTTPTARSMNFDLDNRERARLRAIWTVTGSVAADGCDPGADWTVRVRVAEDTQQNLTVDTATAACEAGNILFDALPPPANPLASRFQVSVFLMDPLNGQIASATEEDLQIFEAETTTVTVDLDPP